MRKKTTPLWSGMLIVMMFVLTACVRPVPTPPTNTPIPTSEVAIVPTPLPPVDPPPEEVPTDNPDPVAPETTPVPEPTTEPTGTQIYVVQPGDSLGAIAEQFNTTIVAIQQANNMGSSTLIHPGDELIIPGADFTPTDPATPSPVTPPPESPDGENNNNDGQGGTEKVHIVQPGENLFRIGYNNGCSTQQMARHNQIPNPWYIYPGQEIRIPTDC